MKLIVAVVFICVIASLSKAQPIPGKEENIPYLVTFGKQGETKWGDDDYCQVMFVVIPKEITKPFYVRVFDPDVAGEIDEVKADANTKTKFSIYGGKLAYSHPDAGSLNPVGNFKSGTLINSKIFSVNPEFDSKWFSFGPINPKEGEYLEEFSGYVFKIIAEGMEGNDGNLYKYFISTSSTDNLPVEGTNSFPFEYTFRLDDKVGSVSHIYPYIADNVVKVNIHVFDLDDDAYMRMISIAKKGEKINGSIDDQWSESSHVVEESEKNTSLDIQIIKFASKPNNNVVIYITNQYNKFLPFYSIPIGGVPKYKYKINVK
ncbi:MAG: hypothetical protein ACKVOU_09415 [Cytophagales bacterium]